ncbi:uncharacterized protein LOC127837163 [Dreissena polymorpha]|nr:uncharacterized protein LOC127837163 [Dreissena polymorpha]XP_052220036.1 uncharacterized protein LOC127837163 [Dreissena polymorpha]XP_052220037.1 uncharacterized protein LOC127837163 [Dreissena polymorpha]XP_052220039.1 uncharacterized protein LOC127837163 [Dreissena polymorpha]XP_052220040.1 uncharacterized protein LOC127837163 [Dreissena polymorpha]XP_052220041.1 uncharacterized protein LOC127837163 [Dreissena polymorpha]XP_052220042.1 uncharacterized protein LOC127837163 [Dreissena po
MSNLRSEILTHDMSNIEILVNNGSKELFELLRDTSIGILDLGTADCASLASEILHTLNKLTKLYLWGTYTGRCDLRLPASLQCICLVDVKCSSEWLCSLLITLSSLDHPVECVLWDVAWQSSKEARGKKSQCSTNVKADVNDSSNTNVSDLHTQMLSCDMSNIELRVLKFQKELFEMLRGTSIRSVQLQAFDDVSLTFLTQNTLPAFTEIRLQGTYLNDFNHTLPSTLQLIILQEGSCSSDWLYSLMLKLSTLNHAVRVYLAKYIVLQRREAIGKYPEPLMRGADLSSVKLEVLKDCPGLYETLPTMHITSLNMTKIEHTDLLSQTLPLLTHLQQLRICLNKYDMEMKLPECVKYVFIIYKTLSPSSLQQYVNNLSTIKHSVQCKLLIRMEENDDEYTRIKQNFCELKSVNVEQFEIVNKKGTVRRAAALTLSATADDCDDDYDKHLLRREGDYVDSKPWIHYCKIRLNILFTDACGVSS